MIESVALAPPPPALLVTTAPATPSSFLTAWAKPARLKLAPEATLKPALVLSTLLAPAVKLPWVTAALPVKLFAPLRIKLPAPTLLRLPVPEITLAIVKVAVVPIAPVPVKTMELLAATEAVPVKAPAPPLPLPIKFKVSPLASANAPRSRVPLLAVVWPRVEPRLAAVSIFKMPPVIVVLPS